MLHLSVKLALAATALAAFVALGVAFSAEWWGGLVPCALCLVERWPYRIVIALSLLGLLLPRPLAQAALALVLLTGIASIAASGTHVGVEFGWWPSPLPECAAPKFAQGSIADRLRSMPAHPAKPCDDPIYPVEAIPLSFAQMGLLYSVAFSLCVATLLTTSIRRAR